VVLGGRSKMVGGALRKREGREADWLAEGLTD
jgi:hypothetical protein